MRVIKDGFGTVTKDGAPVHTNVRFLVDDQRRVAVFTARAAPTVVYGPGEVEYQSQRKPCACKGDPPRMTLQRLWMDSERAAARAS